MKNLLLFLFTSLTVVVMMSVSTVSPPQLGYNVGDQAADFNLKNVDGSMLSLSNARYAKAKGFIIVFTCNHCPFSKKYEDRIIALSNKYEALGFHLIAINPNDPVREPEDSFENMVKLAKEKNYPFPYLLDETQTTAKAYGAQKTPHVYVLKKEGQNLTVAYIGAIDDNSLKAKDVKEKYTENAVDELIEGKPVSKPLTKAVGCMVKWRQQ
jgi:peroxiredoxin